MHPLGTSHDPSGFSFVAGNSATIGEFLKGSIYSLSFMFGELLKLCAEMRHLVRMIICHLTVICCSNIFLACIAIYSEYHVWIKPVFLLILVRLR
jgi:hypothetical protein